MTEDSVDLKMENYKLKTELTEAQVMYFEKSRELEQRNNELRQKNDKIEELQRIVEELNGQILTVTGENKELKEKLNKLQGETEVEKELSKKELKQLQSEVKNYKNRQIFSSKNIEIKIETMRNNMTQIANDLGLLEKEAAVLKDKESMEVQSAENYSQTDEKITVEKAVATEVQENSLTVESNTSVLIMGGINLNTIYLLDSNVQSWKKLNITLPVAMRDFGAALVNNEIYIFGGHSNNYGYHQNCYKLKSDGKWMELASLNEKRSYISNSSVVYFGEIWVIGGHSGNKQYLKSVEKYNIPQNKWIQMPEMNQEKCVTAAAVFKDKIIVTGGWNNSDFLNSVELFDPELQKWTLFCDTPIKICRHSMTITGSILTIYGGVSGPSATKSVWEMDIEDSEKKWTKKQDLKYARDLFGVAKLSNGIMAFGGGNGTTEIFNGNNWIDGPKLPQELSNFAFTPIPRSFEETLIQRFT